MAVVRLTLSYDGSFYHGWQRQPQLPTIQQAIEEVLFRLTGTRIQVYGAGRTDAGVHALAQVAHFTSEAVFTPATWMRGLNALLPGDIAVREVEIAPSSFHARFSACGKIYTYFIHHGVQRSPFQRYHAWHCGYPLNFSNLRRAAKALEGEHDFTSFCAADDESARRVVQLRKLTIQKRGEQIQIQIEGSHFLKQMVRNLVGFLVEVGRGRRSADEIAGIFKARDRRKAGPTAPPQGLFLVAVQYPEDAGNPETSGGRDERFFAPTER
jgi:tRNA pseudouridine38-40 synthase